MVDNPSKLPAVHTGTVIRIACPGTRKEEEEEEEEKEEKEEEEEEEEVGGGTRNMLINCRLLDLDLKMQKLRIRSTG